ncbi:uncharacterized protein LOC105636321 [Jatropha curcas]|uniref:uncharacterized protein LOC105636321 n=1 Tax=Jatropha curcas TaxID=180498 RepID=UPI0009D6D029|nr:uncharacterized protein LOC105636321 [Jatropha curcas]
MSCSMFSSSRAWLQIAEFLTLVTLFCANVVSSSHPDIPNYRDYCNSIVPESTTTSPELTTIPFPPNQDGYYLGGDGIFEHPNSTLYYYSSTTRKVLVFQTDHVHSTNVDGVYKVEGSLILQPSRTSYYVEDVRYSYSYSPQVISSWSERGALSFQVEGFWSKSTGQLCMVGSSSSYSEQGKAHRLHNAVLKLDNVKSESTITSLIKGTLVSLSSADGLNHFEPISILMFPLMKYAYTEVSKEPDSVCAGETDTAKISLSLPLSKSICSIFSGGSNSFKLLYASDCDSAKNCNPFGDSVGYLPRLMSLNLIQCSSDKPSLRFLLEFPNSSYADYYLPFNPNATFIAEGSWNAKENKLCVVACRISAATSSLNSSIVKDCSIRMSFRFPSVWSIGNISDIVGNIWSKKRRNELGYFKRIRFQNYMEQVRGIPGLKYEYSLVDKARKSCPEKQPSRKKGSQYPDPDSNEMQFDMSFKNSSGKRVGYGYARPVFVGDHIFARNRYRNSMLFSNSTPAKIQQSGSLKISYNINFPFLNASSNEQIQVELSAEGIYDAETGVMCLVGCRYLDSNNQIPKYDVDCEILVNVEFPTVDSNNYIQGHINSTREESDPLYLQPLSFSAVSYYNRHARESIWRMDFEIIMALISNTLLCFFVGYQIFYVKKNPNMFPFVSILMLIVLILGQMLPLMLNFEALFFSKENRQSYLRRSGGWLELNEVIVRVITMVSFLLQVRLLQLVWSARLTEGNSKASWIAEKKTAFVCLPLYVLGASIALSVNWKDYEFGHERNSPYYISSSTNQHSLWVDLRSYAGLVLDSFLLPQIIVNIFNNSRENALSCFFYIGTTFVRLIPHAYDLYRAHYYSEDFEWSYMYANPSVDYYSTSWDLIIPLGGLVFAAIVYLQQRNGGRFFLPKRLKELEAYEKLPVASDDP